MAVEQSSTPKDLRPLNLSRAAGDDPLANVTDGFFPGAGFLPSCCPDGALESAGMGSESASCFAAAWPPPRPTATATVEPVRCNEIADDPRSRKVKFLCSFGGKILPRPSDGALRYVGGQTRIIGFRRSIGFQELVQKMEATCGQCVVIKYQLPGEDLDALVSVSCPEDLENMMEEYEKLAEKSDGSGKFRVFLFSASDGDPSEVHFAEIADVGQRYVDAVNGIQDGVCGIQRKESAASLSSLQNPDVLTWGGEAADSLGGGHGDFVEALLPAALSPTGALPGFPPDGGRSVNMPLSIAVVAEPVQLNLPPISTGCPRTVSPSGSESELERQAPASGQPLPAANSQTSASINPPITTFVYNYLDSWVDCPQNPYQVGYMNPQAIGATRQVYHPQQLVSHQCVPTFHATVALPSPKLSVKPVEGCQQFAQLHPHVRVEDRSAGVSLVQFPADQGYQIFQSQTLPQQQSVQQYNWHLLPPVSSTDQVICTNTRIPHPLHQGIVSDPAEKIPALDELFICQKGLPHAQSDTLLQENVTPKIAETDWDTFMSLQNRQSDENVKFILPQRMESENEHAASLETIAVAPPTSVPSLPNVVDPHSVSYGFPQVPEHQHDSERINVQKADKLDYPSTLLPLGIADFPVDGQASYGMFSGDLSQSSHEALIKQPTTSRYQVKQDKTANKTAGNDMPPARSVPFQTSEPSLVGENLACVPGDDASSQFKVKLDSLASRTDLKAVPLTSSNAPFEACEPSSLAGQNHLFVPKVVSDVSSDHLKTIERRVEVPCIAPLGVVGAAEQHKLHNNPTRSAAKDLMPEIILHGSGFSPPVVPSNVVSAREETPVIKAQSSVKDANTITESMASLERNYGMAFDPFPPPSGDADLLKFHPEESNFLSQIVGNARTYQNLGVGIDPSVPSEMWQSRPTLSYVDLTLIPRERQEEGSRFHGRRISTDEAAPTNSNSLLAAAHVGSANGMISDNQDLHYPSSSLFSCQDPWKLQHDMHFSPPIVPNVTCRETLVSTDSNGLSRQGSSGELDIPTSIEEGPFQKPPKGPNKDSFSETGQSAKEEQAKQELQAVAEGVAASVFQSSIPPMITTSVKGRNGISAEPKQDDVPQHDEALNTTTKDVKDFFLDKAGFSLTPTAEGISRLQIIKNIDLEELRELGSGTFGTVYHGKWRGTDVAIKRINDRFFAGKPSEQARMRDDFWNEACKLADLHHPNVLAFYGVVLDGPGESVATVTEYMVNGSLRNALQRNDKTLDYLKRLMIAMDVAFGMEYLHGKNIVHLDLKSDNLLVNLRDPHRPICKVGDLGLSKVKCQTLISGGVRGTLPWMAPELLNGSSSLVSEKVDVFSFGIVMWELLTGQEPYADLHYGAIIGGIVSNTLRPPVPENCDLGWRSLMEKCWSSEPSERPSFTEIAGKLRSMAASLPTKGQLQNSQTQK